MKQTYSTALVLFLASVASADEVDFNRDVRPILSDKCYHCHGPDEENRKANLRLDEAEGAIRALEGSRPEETRFLKRILDTNPRKRMPPPDANFAKELTAKEIDVLKAWLAGGAKYAKHWSFEPATQKPLPEIVAPTWKEPIDRLVAARLKKAGLTPSPRADRATLIRRVTLDLTGLPPTPAEVDAFVQDPSPNAYEKVVDRLLASPHYGERMALFWMDLARYGDSSVYHADGYRDMWGWRDVVINSFNRNQPFDQFTIDQLAGDLVPGAKVEQKIASGFNRNHATTDEGGVIAEEFRVDYVVDRVKTVSSTWLAMSFECGQCHDHKYDPLSQKEYYQFYAFFNNTKDSGMQSRGGNAAPTVPVPDPERENMLKETAANRTRAERDLANERAGRFASSEFRKWLETQTRSAPPLRKPPVFAASLDEPDKSSIAVSADGQVATSSAPLASGKRPEGGGVRFDGKSALTFAKGPALDASRPFTVAAWLFLPVKGGEGPIAASIDGKGGVEFRVVDGRLTMTIQSPQDPKKLIKVASKSKFEPNKWRHVAFAYDGGRSAAGAKIIVDGKADETETLADDLADASPFAKEQPLQIAEGLGKGRLVGSLDDLVVFKESLNPEETKAASNPAAGLLAGELDRDPVVFDHYLRTEGDSYEKRLRELSGAVADENKFKSAPATAMIMEDNAAMRPTFILNRGQYDQPMKDRRVEPGVPAAFPPLPKDAPANRLGLAQWLVQPEHPLTSRVAINRFWQLFFGEGLVRTTEDFGLMGEMPSHPDLLDWLAVDFVKSGWDVKRMIKQIVQSETYCQESRTTPKHLKIDPENRLLARGARVRLPGEFIRDGALFVSGLMVEKVGGRSVKPYQPKGVWEEVTLSGERYVPEKGDKLYRRSMYTFWKRSAPHPAMLTFDVPTREKCTGYRPRTNTPLQALVTLNDPQFVEAARAFAERIVKEGGPSAGERIRFAYREALGRPATDAETKVLERLAQSQRSRFTANPKQAEALLGVGESPRDAAVPAVEHAAWTIVASTVLNLDEFLMKN